MIAVFRTLIAILLLKSAPQALPYSLKLLWLLLGSHIFLGALMVSIYHASHPNGAMMALLVGLVRTGMLAMQLGAALALVNLSVRFVQSLVSLSGVGIILDILALLLSFWFLLAYEAGWSVDMAILLTLFHVIWQWIVHGHILRHVFSTKYPQGFTLGILFFLVSYLVILGMFSEVLLLPTVTSDSSV